MFKNLNAVVCTQVIMMANCKIFSLNLQEELLAKSEESEIHTFKNLITIIELNNTRQ